MIRSKDTFWQLRGNTGGAIAEFGPAFFLLLFIVVPALLGMLSLLAGAATLYFVTNAAARNAGPATTFLQAQANMADTAAQILGGPLGALARITPRDGSGMQIEVMQLQTDGQDIVPFSPPLNSAKYLYQYQISSPGYSISPLFWPGKAIPINFKSSSQVEHAEGLAQ